MSKPTYSTWEDVPDEVVLELMGRPLEPGEEPMEPEEWHKWLAEQLGLKPEQIPLGGVGVK